MGTIKQLRWWAYKILPLAYDDSLSYYEVLAKATQKLNEVIDTTNKLPEAISEEIKKQLSGDDDDVFNNLFSGLINAIATKEADEITFTPSDKQGGEIVWLGDTLYEVVAPMVAGTNYIVGTNIVPVDIDGELEKIKGYICTHNEYFHERATQNHDTQTYLYWKDKLYRVDADIHVNDIIAERSSVNGVTTGQLTLVNTMDEITAHYIEMHEADNNLQTQIDGNDGDIEDIRKSLATYTANNANPKFVNSTAEMTDHNQIYVLSTDKHIYYWNGNEFVDSNLTYGNTNMFVPSTNLINVNTYSDLLPDLNDIEENGIYALNFDKDSTDIPKNLPWLAWKLENNTAILITNVYGDNNPHGLKAQTLISSNSYNRIYANNSWSEWYELIPFDSYKSNQLINYNTYKNDLPDLNNADDNKIYQLNFDRNESNIPANLPWNTWDTKTPVATLICTSNYDKGLKTQTFISDNTYIRYFANNDWTGWYNLFPFEAYTGNRLINHATYSTDLPDLNNASRNKIYELNFDIDDSEIPANLPWEKWSARFPYATLITTSNEDGGLQTQTLITDTIYIRNYANSDWTGWYNYNPNMFLTSDNLININTYKTMLPDLNDLKSNKIIALDFEPQTTDIPANLPWTSWNCGKNNAVLICVAYTGLYQQTLIADGIYHRIYANEQWTTWETSKEPFTDAFVKFKVPVQQTFYTPATGPDIYYEPSDVNCYIKLPKDYTPHGKPTKLVAICHGAGGGGIDYWLNVGSYVTMVQNFVDNGYAIFDCDGYNTETGYNFWGNIRGTTAWLHAYDYIEKNYNVTTDVGIYGFSMGGMTALQLANYLPNVKALALGSPVTDLKGFYDLENEAVQAEMRKLFGMGDEWNSDYTIGQDPFQAIDTDGVYHWHCPPTHMWFGSTETHPSAANGKKLIDAMRKAGNYAIYSEIEGAGHEICYGENPTANRGYVVWMKTFF